MTNQPDEPQPRKIPGNIDGKGAAPQWVRSHTTLVGALIVSAFTVALYIRTAGLGFFGDDPSGHFRFIEQVPWSGWFTSSPGFFFRPLVFVVYKLLWLVFGGYSAPGFHLTLLVLHVANTVLLGVFASSRSRRPLYGWLAALLFASFPLSHEAVAGADALAHPLVAFWVLLALVLFEQGRRTGKSAWLWAIHPVILLALLTHENGLAIPVLLLLLDLLDRPPTSARALVRQSTLQYFVIPALYLLWWLQIPKDPSTTPRTLDALLHNTLPFVQVAAYPLLPLVRLTVDRWGALLALAGAALVLTYVSARALGIVRLWLFALAWLVVVSLPSILFLEWDYLHGGPHLYYLASVGAALLWATLPAAIFGLAKGTAVRRSVALAAGALLTALMLLPPLRFVACHLDLWEQATGVVRSVSAQAAAAPAGRNLVFVNLPAFITVNAEHPQGCPATYPFVTTGVVIFPPYAELSEFIRVNGGPDRPARGVTVAEYDATWPPRYGAALPLAEIPKTLRDNEVAVFEIDRWSLRALSAAWEPGSRPVDAPLATFGDALVLEDVTIEPGSGRLDVTLQWQLRQTPASPVTAFVHVYDRNGQLLAQHDGPIGQNGAAATLIPFELWQRGDRIRDLHTVALSAPLPAEGYTIAAGVYDPATVERLPARKADGSALSDNLYRLER